MESQNNYPKITVISRRDITFKVDPKDPNFDKPLSELTTTYENPFDRVIIPLEPEPIYPFEIITVK